MPTPDNKTNNPNRKGRDNLATPQPQHDPRENQDQPARTKPRDPDAE